MLIEKEYQTEKIIKKTNFNANWLFLLVLPICLFWIFDFAKLDNDKETNVNLLHKKLESEGLTVEEQVVYCDLLFQKGIYIANCEKIDLVSLQKILQTSKQDLIFPKVEILADTLNVTVDDFHKKYKKRIINRFLKELNKKIKCDNPDVGYDERTRFLIFKNPKQSNLILRTTFSIDSLYTILPTR